MKVYSTTQHAIFTALFPLLSLLCACPPPSADGGTDGGGQVADLQISEVMAKNQGSLADEVGEFEDWIELFNAGTSALNLFGYGLSDAVNNLDKYTFPAEVDLEAGDYLIVFADKDPEQGPLHADFKLSGGGEEVALSKNGQLVASFAFGPQCPDVSFGSATPGATPTFLEQPTPGTANSDARTTSPNCAESDAGPPLAPDPALGVVFNEIASAGTSLLDDASETEPWLELVNTTASALDLSGHALTDDVNVPEKWIFPTGQLIAAGGYLLLFLDGEPQEGLDHTGFRLAAGATNFYLLGPDREELDRAPITAGIFDQTQGRPFDVGDTFSALAPTPRAVNGEALLAADGGPP